MSAHFSQSYTSVVHNIGTLISGDLEQPLIEADTLVSVDGIITFIGRFKDVDLADAQLIIDAKQSTVMPGLIDNHTHPTLGEYSPRSGNHSWIWHSLQGGVTSMISAGEVHVPGLPTDRVGAIAMAIAAQRSFANARPSGIKMEAGAPLLNDEFGPEDFLEMSNQGIRHLGEVGIGPVKSASTASALVKLARKYGLTSITHTGGPSISASQRMGEEEILEIDPDIIGHINGGYTALAPRQIRCLCEGCLGALEIVHNGNELAAVTTLNYARELNQLDRIVIGTDSPAGCGVPALGMLRTIALLSSVGGVPAETAICFATGNTAKIRKLNRGILAIGREADLIVACGPLGGTEPSVLKSLSSGDLPSITSILIDGRLVIRQSRNSPPPSVSPDIQEYLR
ncbi:amidohydrolase family protein [Pseudomonas guariconensis]|uniref:amidohydrolase family protein n=1 Tax=Pseudomonas TaxID=286 RepID=UPI001CE46329|nr:MULTISPECIES: amidohydrolase family protein [Pseudomonas]MCO7632992.1 amidohydrolase family protein [Pseudomonas guariconensis]